jgi:integrase
MKIWEKLLKVEGWRSDYGSVDKALRHYARKVKSEKTRENFCTALMLFCKYHSLDPDALVALSPEEASKICQDFTDYLRDKSYSVRYVNVSQAYLKTFFKKNGFKAERELKVERYHQPTRYRKKPEYIPTSEEIYRMGYAAGSSKNRAMIFILYTAGLRNSTLRALLYKDTKEELMAELNVVKIPVYPEMKKVDPAACKGDIPYYTFVDPETVKALREYLEEREQRFGDVGDEEPLFCSDSNQVPRSKQRFTPVSKNGLERMVKRAARQAGIEQWKDVTPKCLRKAYESALRNNRLDPKDQEFLMGHILPGTQDPYYDYTKIEQLSEKYMKIEFFSHQAASIEELRKKQVLDMVKVLGFSDEKIKRVEEALAKYEHVDEALEEIKKLSLESYKESNERINDDDCNGKGNCRKHEVKLIRGEQRLIRFLSEGWDLIKELSNDRFLLKKSFD